MAASATEDPEMAEKQKQKQKTTQKKKAARERKFGFYIQRGSSADMQGSVFMFWDDFFFFFPFLFALQPPILSNQKQP